MTQPRELPTPQAAGPAPTLSGPVASAHCFSCSRLQTALDRTTLSLSELIRQHLILRNTLGSVTELLEQGGEHPEVVSVARTLVERSLP